MTQPQFSFRKAEQTDLPAIIAMLADDDLGTTREDPRMPPAQAYVDAFREVVRQDSQLLAVAIDSKGKVAGCMQITFIPGIARMGAWRGQIEGVRVHRDHRGAGLGHAMMEWAIAQCRNRGCSLVQLTSDRTRPDAHRFYETLGFEASHVGYKLKL
jgi:ribosomal protein S18 acetylase RimI-like enzyme